MLDKLNHHERCVQLNYTDEWKNLGQGLTNLPIKESQLEMPEEIKSDIEENKILLRWEVQAFYLLFLM